MLGLMRSYWWFTLIDESVQRIIPKRYQKPLLKVILVTIPLLAACYTFGDKVIRYLEYKNGPDVVIGVVGSSLFPGDKLDSPYGGNSLLYEFKFNNKALATELRSSKQLEKLFNATPTTLLRPECPTSLQGQASHIYRLNLIAQNNGDETAKDYEMMVTFSTRRKANPDPGIRILGVGADSFDVGYLYQQLETQTTKNILEQCPSLAPFLQDLTVETPNATKNGDNSKAPPLIPLLVKDTYRQLKLTRDLLILDATLEANLFQAATVLVAIPDNVRRFAVLFHVECANCSWFYKTNTYGQIVAVDDNTPAPASAR